MTSTQTAPKQLDLLGLDDPEQYKDRKGTPEPKSPFESDNEKVERSETELFADDTKFSPNKIYYIQGHHMASKQITIVDITDKVAVNFVDGKNVSEEFRDAAKAVGSAKDASPAFVLKKKHWYNKSYEAFAGADTKTPVADWKHPTWSTGTAHLGFPSESKHCSHDLSVAPLNWTRRTNQFVVDSVPLSWQCDDKYKSNRMTLSKSIGGVNTTVARYTQKWRAWGLGGVVLLDNREVDDLVVVLTACTMLRRMEQRRWERNGGGSGGGGGGGGA